MRSGSMALVNAIKENWRSVRKPKGGGGGLGGSSMALSLRRRDGGRHGSVRYCQLARRLGDEARYIGRERAPDLQMKAVIGNAPEHDFGLGEHRARAHAERKGTAIQVQWTAGGQHGGRVRTGDDEPHLAMADIYQRMRQIAQRLLEPVCAVGRRGVFPEQQALVACEPEWRAATVHPR